MGVQETRLDSWKAIAQYLGRNERTVQRWEFDRELPVHRLPGAKRGGVFAYPVELDVWMAGTPMQDSGEWKLDGSVANDAGATLVQGGFAYLRRRPRILSAVPRAFRRESILRPKRGAAATHPGCKHASGRTPGSGCPILDGKLSRLLAGRSMLGGKLRLVCFDKPSA